MKLTHIQIDEICKNYNIWNYTINDDMSISVNGSIDFSMGRMIAIPIRFKEVSGDFLCSYNHLESLEGCPEIVGGDFNCSYNDIKSLEGCPEIVGGNFNCGGNKISSLKHCPKKIDGDISFYDNELKSLEFFPSDYSGEVSLGGNEITNFDGLPEFFESDIWIYGNPVYEIYTLFNDPKCIYWIREFDVIQGNTVIKDRLEEVYAHMGLEMPRDIKFEEYILV